MSRELHYSITTTWTGSPGAGTLDPKAYSRNLEIRAEGKQTVIPGSSDPAFRGDPARYNPEELLVSAISACHMLWMLHLCAVSRIVVTGYSDHASGAMKVNPDGSGQFTSVKLRPCILITDPARAEETRALNEKAHSLCFVARSVNFPVEVEPEVAAAPAAGA